MSGSISMMATTFTSTFITVGAGLSNIPENACFAEVVIIGGGGGGGSTYYVLMGGQGGGAGSFGTYFIPIEPSYQFEYTVGLGSGASGTLTVESIGAGGKFNSSYHGGLDYDGTRVIVTGVSAGPGYISGYANTNGTSSTYIAKNIAGGSNGYFYLTTDGTTYVGTTEGACPGLKFTVDAQGGQGWPSRFQINNNTIITTIRKIVDTGGTLEVDYTNGFTNGFVDDQLIYIEGTPPSGNQGSITGYKPGGGNTNYYIRDITLLGSGNIQFKISSYPKSHRDFSATATTATSGTTATGLTFTFLTSFISYPGNGGNSFSGFGGSGLGGYEDTANHLVPFISATGDNGSKPSVLYYGGTGGGLGGGHFACAVDDSRVNGQQSVGVSGINGTGGGGAGGPYGGCNGGSGLVQITWYLSSPSPVPKKLTSLATQSITQLFTTTGQNIYIPAPLGAMTAELLLIGGGGGGGNYSLNPLNNPGDYQQTTGGSGGGQGMMMYSRFAVPQGPAIANIEVRGGVFFTESRWNANAPPSGNNVYWINYTMMGGTRSQTPVGPVLVFYGNYNNTTGNPIVAYASMNADDQGGLVINESLIIPYSLGGVVGIGLSTYNPQVRLPTGNNSFILIMKNTGGPSGVWFALTTEKGGAGTVIYKTDSTWSWSSMYSCVVGKGGDGLQSGTSTKFGMTTMSDELFVQEISQVSNGIYLVAGGGEAGVSAPGFAVERGRAYIVKDRVSGGITPIYSYDSLSAEGNNFGISISIGGTSGAASSVDIGGAGGSFSGGAPGGGSGQMNGGGGGGGGSGGGTTQIMAGGPGGDGLAMITWYGSTNAKLNPRTVSLGNVRTQTKVYTTGAGNNLPIPTGAFMAKVILVGAGGGGGGIPSSGISGSSGGGGGAICICMVPVANLDSSLYSYNVGSGGLGGTSGSSGISGEDSFITINGATIRAGGGGGGRTSSSSLVQGGSGGTITITDSSILELCVKHRISGDAVKGQPNGNTNNARGGNGGGLYGGKPSNQPNGGRGSGGAGFTVSSGNSPGRGGNGLVIVTWYYKIQDSTLDRLTSCFTNGPTIPTSSTTIWNNWARQLSFGNWLGVSLNSLGTVCAACVYHQAVGVQTGGIYIGTNTTDTMTWAWSGVQTGAPYGSGINGMYYTVSLNYDGKVCAAGSALGIFIGKYNPSNPTQYNWSGAQGSIIFNSIPTTEGVWLNLSLNNDGNVCIAVDAHNSLGGKNPGIWIGSDLGAAEWTWTRQSPTRSGDTLWKDCSISGGGLGDLLVCAACSATDGNVWIGTYNSSTPYQYTWTKQTSIPTGYWLSVSLSKDGRTCAACQNGGFIYIGYNTGSTEWGWQKQPPQQQWQSVSLDRFGTVCAACSYTDRGVIIGRRLSNSTWFWSFQTENIPSILSLENIRYRNVSLNNEGTICVASIENTVQPVNLADGALYIGSLRPVARITQWYTQGSPLPSPLTCRGVSLNNSGNVCALATFDGNGIFIGTGTPTSESSLTWTDQTSTGNIQFSAISMNYTGNVCGASTYLNKLYIGTYIVSTQWKWEQQDGLGSADWRSVSMNSNGDVCAACTLQGYIWIGRYSNNEWTWKDETPSYSAVANPRYAYIWISLNGPGTVCAACGGLSYDPTAVGSVSVGRYSGSSWTWTNETPFNLSTKCWNHIKLNYSGDVCVVSVWHGYLYVGRYSGTSWDWEEIYTLGIGTHNCSINSAGTIIASVNYFGHLWIGNYITNTGTVSEIAVRLPEASPSLGAPATDAATPSAASPTANTGSWSWSYENSPGPRFWNDCSLNYAGTVLAACSESDVWIAAIRIF